MVEFLSPTEIYTPKEAAEQIRPERRFGLNWFTKILWPTYVDQKGNVRLRKTFPLEPLKIKDGKAEIKPNVYQFFLDIGKKTELRKALDRRKRDIMNTIIARAVETADRYRRGEINLTDISSLLKHIIRTYGFGDDIRTITEAESELRKASVLIPLEEPTVLSKREEEFQLGAIAALTDSNQQGNIKFYLTKEELSKIREYLRELADAAFPRIRKFAAEVLFKFGEDIVTPIMVKGYIFLIKAPPHPLIRDAIDVNILREMEVVAYAKVPDNILLRFSEIRDLYKNLKDLNLTFTYIPGRFRLPDFITFARKKEIADKINAALG